MLWDDPAQPTFSVPELGEAIGASLRGAFPDEVWVRGVIRNLNPGRRGGTVWFDLVEPAAGGDLSRPPVASLPVVLFDLARRKVNARLTDADPWLSLFFDSKEIPDPATGNKGTNFAHYRGIDDLLHAGRVERDVKKRAAIYAEAQKRMERDLVCLPISDVPGQWARNPKRVSTPFAADYGEFSLHYSYNYPEMLKVLN